MENKIEIERIINESIVGGTVAGAADLTSGYIDVQGCSRVQIRAWVGTTTSTTAFTVLQATSDVGAGSKVATALGQLGAAAIAASDLPFAADDDGQEHTYDIELAEADLDGANGFHFIAVHGDVTGGTTQAMAMSIKAYPVPYIEPES
jgi:hypothetical protein